MTQSEAIIKNAKDIKKLIDQAKKISGLPSPNSPINIEDEIAVQIKSTGQTVKRSISELIDGGVGNSTIYESIPLSFSADKITKGDIHNLFGGLNKLITGGVLSTGNNITSNNGRSKILIVIKAGTDVSGSFNINGTKVDRNTAAETPNYDDVITVDSLSVDTNSTDGLGNPTYDLVNCYMSTVWFADGFTISTTDLNLSNVDVYSISFEQFNDAPSIEVDSLNMSANISNALAEFSGHAYSVEVVDGKTSVTSFADMEIPAADINAGLYRMRKGNIGKEIDGTSDGVFVDVNFMPFNQTYFEAITFQIWVKIPQSVSVVIDGSLGLDSIVYGEDLQAGNLVYLKSDGKYWKASNASEATSITELRLILESGLADDEKLALAKGQYESTGFTAGLEYVGTNGTVTSSRPTGESEVVRIVSSAINTTTRYFDPSKTWINGTASKINGITIPSGANNEFFDTLFKLINYTNQTKKVSFDLSGIDPNTEIILQSPTESGKIALVADILNQGISALSGGSISQILKKNSGDDYDWSWVDDIEDSNGDIDTYLYEGDAVPLSGMDAYVFAQKYKIAGELRTTLISDTVTSTVVDIANPTFKRWDVYIVQDNGDGNPDTIEVLSSAESANPIKPVPDLSYQLEISFARFSAGETTPDDFGSHIVYAEHTGGEATVTSTDASIDPDSIVNPITGTKSILATTPPHLTDTFFDLLTPQYTLANKILKLTLDLDETWEFLKNNRYTIDVYLWSGGRAFTGRVRIGSDFGFGFDGDIINQSQIVAIRLDRFDNWSSENTFDRIQFRYQRLNTKTFRIDDIAIVNAIETSVTNIVYRTSEIPVNDGSNSTDSKVYLEADVSSGATGSRPTKQPDGSLVFEVPDSATTEMDDMSNMTASKTTPIDADNLTLWDSVAGTFKKLTWANLKATLKTYFDTLYAPTGSGGGVENDYGTLALLIAGQGSQTDGRTQFVVDASGFTGITSGYAYVEYLGTTVGAEDDYRIISTQESSVFTGGYKEQAFSSLSTWTWNHNLGVQYPTITCVDANDKEFIPLDIEYVSTSQVVITHTTAKTGIAIANTGATAVVGDDTIGLNQLADELKKRNVISALEIDWSLGEVFTKTVTGASTFTDANLPQGTDTKVIELHIDGDFAITFPAYWVWKGGVYDGTVSNMIVASCLNGNSGSEIVNYIIVPNA